MSAPDSGEFGCTSRTYRVCREFKALQVEIAAGRPTVPEYVDRINERTLLSVEQEHDLFVRLNFCKFRADLIGRRLPVASKQETAVCDSQSRQLRDAIVRAYLKLAIAQIGPYISRQHGFEELFSEASMALLRAVEMFDPDRGFRFSTYATTAVRRRLQRFVCQAHAQRQLFQPLECGDGVAAPHSTPADDRLRAASVAMLEPMLARLNEREQLILRARFGLEPGSESQSLQDVAVELGVCRERVRQLEAHALQKLQAMPEAGRAVTLPA